mmetsp:Transcript_8653/g.19170  ORF Transcript_8653/g.19170 Transcript_8653/m.19170 type:complete len:202 (+) Transcript_8653:176-781(+)
MTVDQELIIPQAIPNIAKVLAKDGCPEERRLLVDDLFPSHVPCSNTTLACRHIPVLHSHCLARRSCICCHVASCIQSFGGCLQGCICLQRTITCLLDTCDKLPVRNNAYANHCSSTIQRFSRFQGDSQTSSSLLHLHHGCLSNELNAFGFKEVLHLLPNAPTQDSLERYGFHAEHNHLAASSSQGCSYFHANEGGTYDHNS